MNSDDDTRLRAYATWRESDELYCTTSREIIVERHKFRIFKLEHFAKKLDKSHVYAWSLRPLSVECSPRTVTIGNRRELRFPG